MPGNQPQMYITVRDAIDVYLCRVMVHFERMKEQAAHALKTSGDCVFKGQETYARNCISAIKHIRTQYPKEFNDMLVLDESLQAKIESQAVKNTNERLSCLLSKVSQIYSELGEVLLPNNLSEERQKRVA